MKSELELKLIKKYPKLFRDYGGDMRTTCMTWGCECGDGWYGILKSLCKKLSELNEEIVFVQIKEKFGGLRIYIEHGSNKVYKLIDKAEHKSYKTCEVCGKTGKIRDNRHWIKTLCDICDKCNEE